MRYLILNVGYNQVAIPYATAAELAGCIALLADARQVTSTGYGDDQRYVPTGTEPVQMQFVDGSRITVGDELATLKAKLAEQTRETEQKSRYWLDANEKVKTLERQLKEAQAKPLAATEEPL